MNWLNGMFMYLGVCFLINFFIYYKSILSKKSLLFFSIDSLENGIFKLSRPSAWWYGNSHIDLIIIIIFFIWWYLVLLLVLRLWLLHTVAATI